MSSNTRWGAIALCSLSLFASSCGGGGNDGTNAADTTQMPAAPREITTSEVPASPEFNDAKLVITSVATEKQGKDSAKVNFTFSVSNYELKSQTSDAEGKQCNNSAQGQHIHFILDNKPYVALYEPKHTATVALNSEHYVLVFLSRSYHESLKNKGAAMVYHFKIDKDGKLQEMENPKTPMVFYSRPKGDYLGKDTANVLFDFYVWNAELGTDYKVKAEVKSGKLKKEMEIAEWKPQFLHNLGMGKSSIKLTLIDKNGKSVDGPMTSVTRDFTLAADEPIK